MDALLFGDCVATRRDVMKPAGRRRTVVVNGDAVVARLTRHDALCRVVDVILQRSVQSVHARKRHYKTSSLQNSEINIDQPYLLTAPDAETMIKYFSIFT